MPDVAAEVMKIVDEKRGGSHEPLALSDPLAELGLDSLQVVELTFLIEEKFNIQIPFNANSDIEAKTVGDLIKTVQSLVAAGHRPA